MGSTKVYLVRRDCRQILGPMTKDEFRQSLARLDFGLQDEISGHCGPWVILDRKERLTEAYPEISLLLGDSLPLSWRETTNHAKIISRHRTKSDKGFKAHSNRGGGDGFQEYLAKRRNRTRFLVVISLLLVVGLGFGFQAYQLKKKDELPPIAEMLALSEKSDRTEFLNAMGIKVIPYAAKIIKSQKNVNSWLPLFRLYAYSSTGNIDGVSQKILKGDVPANFNFECTVESWKRSWNENEGQTRAFLSGQALNKNQWTRLLSMDPNWIKRRPQKGWTKPISIHEGCLMTADLAIHSVAEDAMTAGPSQKGLTDEVFQVVRRRIEHQLNVVRGIASISAADASANEVGTLGMLTCLESQTAVAGLSKCKTVIHAALDSFIGEHFVLSLIQVAFAQDKGVVDEQWKAATKDVAGFMRPEDVMGSMELDSELKFLGLVLGGLEIDQAKEKVKIEFPDQKIEH